jgi:hypothetical protein
VRLAPAAGNGGNTAQVLDADERAELEGLGRENAELRLAKTMSDGPLDLYRDV